MTQDEFISKKVEPDRKWYSEKARLYRKLHIGTRILIILLSATITVLTSISFEYKNLIIAILSALIVAVTSIGELMKFKEQWLQYRTTSEQIKSELAFLQTGTEPYDKPGAFQLFVKNYETILKTEVQSWKGFIGEKA